MGTEERKEAGMPFASGKLGGEFRLLRAYIEEAGSKEIVPDEEVFRAIRSVAAGGAPADEVIEAISKIVMRKIDPEAAVKAYRRVYGVEVGESEAVRAVAREAAAWAIELAEALGVVRVRVHGR